MVQAKYHGINPRILGFIAIAVAVTIWASFALSMRTIASSHLTTADVILIRFTIPALILLPFVPARLPFFRSLKQSKPLLVASIMVVVGAGLPFYFLTAIGAKATSATHVGALVAGTAPLSTILVKRLLYKQAIHPKLAGALLLILLGIILMVLALPNATNANYMMSNEVMGVKFIGIGALLLASLCWGLNTVGLQQLKTDTLGLAMILVYPSVIGIGIMMMFGRVESHLWQASMADLLPFILVQGLAVGIVSTLTYAFAIQQLGSSLSATIGSLAPALACLMAIPILGEIPNSLTVIAVLVLVLGVIISTKVMDNTQSSLQT